MIDFLRGKIIHKTEKSATLDVSGVGYLMFAPSETLSKFTLGDEGSFFIRTIVREDAISLYGFDTREAQTMFDLLLTVTRVGPKTAMDILAIPLQKIQQAISKKDMGFLSRIPGVGKKTAERILLELHDKVKTEGLMDIPLEHTFDNDHPDISEALQKLGYNRNHISRVLGEMPKEVTGEENIIKYFLQHA